jgi:hypothetical protein
MRCGNLSDLENSPDQLTEESDEEFVSLASTSDFSLSVLDGDPDEDLASSSFLESIVDVGDASIDDGELSPGAPFPVVFLGVNGGVSSAASATLDELFAATVLDCLPPAIRVDVASSLIDPSVDVDAALLDVLDFFSATVLDCVPPAIGVDVAS